MPADLFVGKSNVQTYVYVFRVGEAHDKDDLVKFIDFSNDGYLRSNRKKAKNNLRDTGEARKRYDELVALVRYGKQKLNIFTEKEFYEGHIDPDNGSDWNQTAPIDGKPSLADYTDNVFSFLSCEVTNLLKNEALLIPEFCQEQYKKTINSSNWVDVPLEELFVIENTLSFNADRLVKGSEYDYVTRTSNNQGVLQQTGFVNAENINPAGTWSLGLLQMDFFYRSKPWYAGQFVRKITPKFEINEGTIIFFSTLLNKQKPILLSVLVRNVDKVFNSIKVSVPMKGTSIDYELINSFVANIENQYLKKIGKYICEKEQLHRDLSNKS